MADKFEHLREVTTYEIAMSWSPKYTLGVVYGLLAEVDRLSKVEQEYSDFLHRSAEHSNQMSRVLLETALAGSEVERRRQEKPG